MSDQGGLHDLAAGESATTRILVALAAMSTRQEAAVRATDELRAAVAEQHRELMGRVNTFVPRSEIEKDNKAIHDRIDGLDARIERVDGKIWKGIAWVLGTVGTALAGLIGLHMKSSTGVVPATFDATWRPSASAGGHFAFQSDLGIGGG